MNKRRTQEWLLFMTQLPAEPSSARVAVWRRLKSAGAASLLTGTWILPSNEANAAVFGELAETVRRLGGSAAIFRGHHADEVTSEEIITRFQADRKREFDEFMSRSQGLLDEIEKETAIGKFTFAELEEIEDDLEKLVVWLGKISARDIFPNERQSEASEMLARCREGARVFAETVYECEGAVRRATD